MICLTAIIAFVSSNEVTAQTVSDTEKTKTIGTSNKEIKEIEHKGITYYVFNGTWHTKMKNRYVLRNAPKGVKISFKPEGGEYVKMHGKKYYHCKGIFYKEHKDSIYEVVRI
jgi:hypothetical protein